jgi:hypothetical protein
MPANILKTLFPDILRFEKALIKGSSKDLKVVNNLTKALAEDAELLKCLATNEQINK